ncbi:hypothetical protein FJV80_24675 [Mesorhizobium sp. WSM4310]|uniref:hypothetical protein n=1 Tax=Mesorhizobium sp. WSM4310 TaxID=2589883 RepID=UPI00115CBF58|nr:hypothetical protein [Mesorhizobium sp. WSM4310]TRC78540.1 hypothetical protein FJV80_24675 [Mesorhizobium sp. WSM4310]
MLALPPPSDHSAASKISESCREISASLARSMIGAAHWRVDGTASARKAGPKAEIIAARCSPDGRVWPLSHFSAVDIVAPTTLARCAAVDVGNARLANRQKPSMSSRKVLWSKVEDILWCPMLD